MSDMIITNEILLMGECYILPFNLTIEDLKLQPEPIKEMNFGSTNKLIEKIAEFYHWEECDSEIEVPSLRGGGLVNLTSIYIYGLNKRYKLPVNIPIYTTGTGRIYQSEIILAALAKYYNWPVITKEK